MVVYANTSAAVKARSDWLVTSSCALDIVRALKDKGHKILWAPDKHLGSYIQRETGADMVSWNGSCIVHDEFKAFELTGWRARTSFDEGLLRTVAWYRENEAWWKGILRTNAIVSSS